RGAVDPPRRPDRGRDRGDQPRLPGQVASGATRGEKKPTSPPRHGELWRPLERTIAPFLVRPRRNRRTLRNPHGDYDRVDERAAELFAQPEDRASTRSAARGHGPAAAGGRGVCGSARLRL